MQLLIEATRDDEAPVDVIITMRSDFLGDCSQFRDLPETINDGLYLVPRLTRLQLREAITAPGRGRRRHAQPATRATAAQRRRQPIPTCCPWCSTP